MTPGSIIFDKNFEFHDGETGKKYLIILGSFEGLSLIAKTTSQGKRYLIDFGCQITHRFPNFHLVKGSCCLPLPTWICLSEFYIFKHTNLLSKHFKGDIYKYGELTTDIYKALSDCALNSDDISEKHAAVIRESLKLSETNKIDLKPLNSISTK